LSEPFGYLTIARSGSAENKERSSSFLAFCYPVLEKEEGMEFIRALRKKYFDATHVCFAMVLGKHGETLIANDDGEPAHSAGTPILNAIRSKKLTCTLVAVVRYFGGKKLGVPGLIEAYGSVSALALESVPVIVVFPQAELTIKFEYSDTALIERNIKKLNAEITRSVYEEKVELTLKFHEDKLQEAEALFSGFLS
jgi:uncharacterized YigZ family protein